MVPFILEVLIILMVWGNASSQIPKIWDMIVSDPTPLSPMQVIY